MTAPAAPIDRVIDELQRRIDELPVDLRHRRTFIATYRRTTIAVAEEIAAAGFEDPEWVARWDIAFADLFLVAHDADRAGQPVPRPWRLAFAAPDELPDLAHLLLGMNAHINFDLPQALLTVINLPDFDDPVLLARRGRDHTRIDRILARRVSAEDQALGGVRRWRDRLLGPVNREASRRFLAEARRKVWLNTAELHAARLAGPDAYAIRLGELEVLSAAKIADLLAPGQTLIRLAAGGFGVSLPPA